MFWAGITVAVYLLLLWPGAVWPTVLTRAMLHPRRRSARKLETIWFVDGPLAGRTDQIPAGPNGLPPQQFCPVVSRSIGDGGDYTMPYQRGPICDSNHAWQYTQGWQPVDIAVADIGSWPK